MEELQVIKAAHGIDECLGRLAGAVGEESLRARILELKTDWQELAYAITADACGMKSGTWLDTGKKRGRRKKTDETTEPTGPDSLERASKPAEAAITHHS